MAEYWIISAPGDKTCQQTWETMNNLTSKQNNLCENFKMHIPDLKVGTLDQLVGLSDDLGKLDTFVEQITRKLANYLGEVLEDQRDKLQENLLANNKSPEMARNKSKDNDSALKVTKQRYGRRSLDTPRVCDSGTIRKMRSTSESSDAVTKDEIVDSSPNKTHNTSRHFDWWLHRKRRNSSKKTRAERKGGDTVRNGHAEPLRPITTDNKSGLVNGDFTASNKLHHHNYGSTKVLRSVAGGCCGAKSQGRSSSPEMASLNISDCDNNYSDDCRLESKSENNEDENGEGDESESMRNLSMKVPLSPAELPHYLTRFQWDIAKYPIKQSLRNIADIISKQVGQIDADLKTKSTAYNSLKGNLQNLEKKQTGSLMTRTLADIVKKEHFILDSEYLTTLLVVVPKVQQHDWQAHYEKLTDMIVPRSTQLIMTDGEFALFTVTLFKKVVEEFKLHAREKKFFVRDFTYNEEELAAGKNEITKLVTDKKKQFGPLVRWLKVNFSECFCAWIHVKALRVFVESVLRYGLPVNFQAILIHPHKKSQKRLKDVLQQLYGHLDGSAGQGGSANDAVDIPGLGFGQLEYFPYVCYKLSIDMVESKI